MKKYILVAISVLSFISMKAQDFFADENVRDTTKKTFYEKKYQGTVCYDAGYKHYLYGGSVFIHFNNDKFSTYFGFRMNTAGSSTAIGFKTVHQTNATTGLDSTSIAKHDTTYSYKAFVVSIGLAKAYADNLLVYANVGVRYQFDNFSNLQYNGYLYSPRNKNISLLFGGGLVYILPMGLSGKLGMEFPEMTLVVGMGYTF